MEEFGSLGGASVKYIKGFFFKELHHNILSCFL